MKLHRKFSNKLNFVLMLYLWVQLLIEYYNSLIQSPDDLSIRGHDRLISNVAESAEEL